MAGNDKRSDLDLLFLRTVGNDFNSLTIEMEKHSER